MTLNTKNKNNEQTPPSDTSLQDMLVKASQDAEIAKSAVREVFSQALRKRNESLEELDTIITNDIAPGNGRTKKLIVELDTDKRGSARKNTNSRAPRSASIVQPTEVIQPEDRLFDAVSLAREKIRKSREEAETYKKHAQAAVATLEDKEAKMREKIKTLKQQWLISVREAQVKAQKARDEAEAIRRETRATVKAAKMENRKILEDAKMEVMNAQEAARQAKKEANLAILRVDDTIIDVQQELIGITVNEMSETEQDSIEVIDLTGGLAENQSRVNTHSSEQKQFTTNFGWVINLWQSAKPIIQNILYTIRIHIQHKAM